MDGIIERVQLTVTIACIRCERKIMRVADLNRHAVETGNVTQRAVYHLDTLRREVIHEAQSRAWFLENKTWTCAHCVASSKDPK